MSVLRGEPCTALVAGCSVQVQPRGAMRMAMHHTWLEYDADASERYEAALQAGLTEVKVDDERFIDLKDMVQRRYDDKTKRRTVKRTETTKRSIAQSDGSPRKKRRVDDSGGAAAASHNASDDQAPTGGAAAPTVGHLALPNVPAHWDSFDSVSALRRLFRRVCAS